MLGKPHRAGLLRDVAVYVGVFVFSLLFLYRALNLGGADLHTPFYYGGDALLISLPIKGIIDHGWYLENPNIGAPGVHQLYDYPFGEFFYFLCFKVMSLFSHSFGVILNSFFVLSFPLTAVTTLFAFRRLGFSYGPAIVGSMLFAFQSYHFQRSEGHLFLGVYFLLPLMLLVLLRVGAEQPPFLDGKGRTAETDNGDEIAVDHATKGIGDRQRLLGFAGAAGICLLVAMSGFYYAFFAGFFLMIAGVFAALRRHRVAPLVTGVVLAGVVVVGMALCTLPNQMYWRQHGKNFSVGRRGAPEAEIYGLKIIQMLLPVDGHRVYRMDQTKRWYNANVPNVNENTESSLGIVGSTGFLFLMACLVLPERLTARLPASTRLLAQLNLWGVLLATIGGFGMAFALEVTPQIRAYNRISIYIALFGLCAVTACLDAIYRRYRASPLYRWGFTFALGVLLMVGLLDQDGYLFRPDHTTTRHAFSVDARFFQSIEASVPTGAMVFQLPYVPFPENPPVNQMTDYDHLRGYMHSKHLRWSYGAMKGRDDDAWQRKVTALPVPKMVQELQKAGFAGIYVDHFGYKDQGKTLEAKLARQPELAGTPLQSEDKRLTFWRFTKAVDGSATSPTSASAR